jgi:hypothetical protein
MPRAPKICCEATCFNLVYDGGKRCDEHHQAWANKGRVRERTTAAHQRFTAEVLRRAHHRCQIGKLDRCVVMASDVDRIDNTQGYTYDNCQAACGPCHAWKSSMEGHAAQGHRIGGQNP